MYYYLESMLVFHFPTLLPYEWRLPHCLQVHCSPDSTCRVTRDLKTDEQGMKLGSLGFETQYNAPELPYFQLQTLVPQRLVSLEQITGPTTDFHELKVKHEPILQGLRLSHSGHLETF